MKWDDLLLEEVEEEEDDDDDDGLSPPPTAASECTKTDRARAFCTPSLSKQPLSSYASR